MLRIHIGSVSGEVRVVDEFRSDEELEGLSSSFHGWPTGRQLQGLSRFTGAILGGVHPGLLVRGATNGHCTGPGPGSGLSGPQSRPARQVEKFSHTQSFIGNVPSSVNRRGEQNVIVDEPSRSYPSARLLSSPIAGGKRSARGIAKIEHQMIRDRVSQVGALALTLQNGHLIATYASPPPPEIDIPHTLYFSYDPPHVLSEPRMDTRQLQLQPVATRLYGARLQHGSGSTFQYSQAQIHRYIPCTNDPTLTRTNLVTSMRRSSALDHSDGSAECERQLRRLSLAQVEYVVLTLQVSIALTGTILLPLPTHHPE
ncbi:hypothetical protein ACRALDRAFT_207906 [Sodiomyces alcalophilus JCM 7366]|uniref:uncharacterized protein n=1 Tax=Sodiomyces alcalophilus JCM 7366 TaxID=591952 RepID=UPI0039B4D17A